jgi:hypothetical protein
VSKVFVPWSGETVEFGKKEYEVAGNGANSRIENAERLEAMGRHNVGRGMGAGAAAGGAAGAAGGAALARGARGGGALIGGLSGAYAGAVGGAVHGQRKTLRSGKEQGLIRERPKRDPKTGKVIKRGVLLPATPQSSTRVSPLLARGGNVSHENDLYSHKRRGSRRGSPSALAQYRSGSERQMRGGGRRYGHAATHVGKSLDTQQYAAARGTRGTPMTDISRQSRVGRRLGVV